MKCMYSPFVIFVILVSIASSAYAESDVLFDNTLEYIEFSEFLSTTDNAGPLAPDASYFRQSFYIETSVSWGIFGKSISNAFIDLSIGYRRFNINGGFEVSMGREFLTINDDDEDDEYEDSSVEGDLFLIKFALFSFRNKDWDDKHHTLAGIGVDIGFDDVDYDGFEIGLNGFISMLLRQFYLVKLGVFAKYVEIGSSKTFWIGFTIGWIGIDIEFF
ncbi:MAG: hypothetical protein K8S87_07010 [Planctomycetes bacterium]|nr:hypothetical protein [Planctomycetota bacterium]